MGENLVTLEEIAKLQELNGLKEMQGWINTGTAWHLEGSVGREAMRLLEAGACMLPEESHRDYWGNIVPGRNDLKPGTKGTELNCRRFWANQMIETECEV
jgi:hypothetical protein